MPQTRRIRQTDRREHYNEKVSSGRFTGHFAAGASAADKINFGVSATYPPFESLDASNQIVGFDIDLAKALCKQMQADCIAFTNHAFDSLIPSLKFKNTTR